MIDLKDEIERELSLVDPPDLWDRIQAEATNEGDVVVLDLTTTLHRRRPSLWLAVAAVTVLVALVGALALRDDHQTVDTAPATDVPVPQSDPPIDDVSDVSCRAESGVATVAVEITNRSSAASKYDASDYIVRVRIEDGTRTKIGEAVVKIIHVYPGLSNHAQADTPISDGSPGGSEVMNCFVEHVERAPSEW